MNDHQKEQLLVKCSDSMVLLLSPEELEQFAQAEMAERYLSEAIDLLQQRVKARNLSGWQDAPGDKENALLARLSPELREFARQAYPEELRTFAELSRSEGEAILRQGKLMEVAARRQEQEAS